MDKKDWETKKVEFLEMQKKQEGNLKLCQNTLEEIKTFLESIEVKIKTFK